MAEHIPQDLLETILPLIFGIILPIIGGASAGVYVLVKRVIRNSANVINTLNDALADDSLSSEEVRKLINSLLTLIRNDPEASRALLNSKA
jgi:sugar/nucleoside kinase (ribokinase family)